MTLKIGDTVQHKSGGPRMVIERVTAFGGTAIVSYWDEAEQCFVEERFPVGVLRRIA